jgi:desulfoferrodoxin (superoxide reductase-like protein)
MKFSMGIMFWCALIIMISFSCKDDGGIDPKIAEMYKSKDHITPLPEYTAENPREWGKVAHEHIPSVTLSRKNGKDALLISIPLLKPSMEHYIERIGIMDENGKEIASESIPRLANPITYAYFLLKDLPSNRQKLKAFAKCNLHDLWTAPLEPE